MMNETVERMVDLLFKDLEMSAEVQALREEVLDNSRARYEDQMARGATVPEALDNVAESLKGMEEVLAAYPRKQAEAKPAAEPAAEVPEVPRRAGEWRFPARMVQSLRTELRSADLFVETGAGDEVTVSCTPGMEENLNISCSGTVLDVRMSSASGVGHALSELSGFNFSDGFHGLLASVGRMIGEAAASFRVTVTVPSGCRLDADLRSTSGDIVWQGAEAGTLSADSGSGDVRLVAPESCVMKAVRLSSGSGDIEAGFDAASAVLRSISGDVDCTGSVEELSIASTSGDVEADGSFRELQLKTVSGDADVRTSSKAGTIRLASTSGDLRIRTDHSAQVSCFTRTVSGSVRVNRDCAAPVAPLHIEAITVSGSVTIR